MSVHPLDTMLRLRELQMRVLAGERIEAHEYHEILNAIRQGREISAATSAAAPRTSAKRPPEKIDLSKLFEKPI